MTVIPSILALAFYLSMGYGDIIGELSMNHIVYLCHETCWGRGLETSRPVLVWINTGTHFRKQQLLLCNHGNSATMHLCILGGRWPILKFQVWWRKSPDRASNSILELAPQRCGRPLRASIEAEDLSSYFHAKTFGDWCVGISCLSYDYPVRFSQILTH